MLKKQSGSFHAVLLVGIGVALVGAIGYLFYRNIVLQGKVNTTSNSTESKKQATQSKKEYCAEKEKLCFDYPGDWSVEQITNANTASADNFFVTSPDNQLKMQFVSGLGGMGGCCGPTAEGPVTVVDSWQVGGLSLAKSIYNTDQADMPYVSTVVTSKVYAEFADSSDPSSKRTDFIEGYIPQILLHDTKKLAKPQTFQSVQGNLGLMNLMTGKNAMLEGSNPPTGASFLFGTETLGVEASQKVYKTFEEAKKQLANSNFTAAKAILSSVRYQ